MKNDLYQKIYSEYLDQLGVESNQKRHLISFEHGKNICRSPRDLNEMVLCDFGSSAIGILTNDINRFFDSITRLKVWNEVLLPYEKQTRKNLSYAFVEPLFESCLVSPYNIKQRFIYCGTKLRILSRTLVAGSHFQFPKDTSIQLSHLEKWVDNTVKEHNEFLNAVLSLDSTDFADGTGHYRRRKVHRIAQHFVHGLQMDVLIEPVSGGDYSHSSVAYRPLQIATALPALLNEHQLLRSAFLKFLYFARNHFV